MADRAGGRGSDDAAESFGRGGWLLLATIVLALGVVPVLIALRPPTLPFVAAYLVLPLLPAVLLALVAVYVTVGR